MPGNRPHHTDKWRSCVDKVMGQGHDEAGASAICTASMQKAGAPIFEGMESRSAAEFIALGDRPGHEFHGNQHTSGSGGSSNKAIYESVARGMKKPLPTTMKEVHDRASSDLGYASRIFETAKAIGGNPKNHVEAKKIIADHPKGIELLNKDYKAFVAKSQSQLKARGLLGAPPNGTLQTLHLLGATGTMRTEMDGAKEYLVFPVVALMEGVVHAVNSEHPEFVSVATLQKAAASWNDKPIVIGHPVKDGKQCSANATDILDARGIGMIRNSRVEGKKLLQDAWVEKSKVKQLNPNMYNRLLAGSHEEVSVGAFVVTDEKAGKWSEKPYKGSWLDISGDHLAFLPGGRGACSVEMGCGTHRAAMRVCESAMELETLGDVPGHEFHGNQYGAGGVPKGNGTKLEHVGHGKVSSMSHADSNKPANSMSVAVHHGPDKEGFDSGRDTVHYYEKKGSDWYHTGSHVAEEQFNSDGDQSGSRVYGQSKGVGKVEAALSTKLDAAAKAGSGKAFYSKLKSLSDFETLTTEELPECLTFTTLEGQSLDDRLSAVNSAVYKEFNSPPAPPTPYEPMAYPLQVFDDYVIVRKGEEVWSIDYTVDKDGVVTFGDKTAVKQQWVAAAGIRAAAGARHSATDVQLIQAMHDHSCTLGAKCDRSNYKMLGTKPCSCGGQTHG